MTHAKFNRRQIFGAATAGLASQVGASLLTSAELSRHPLAALLRTALGGTAYGQAAAGLTPVDTPVAVVFLSAKCDAGTLLFSDNTKAVGVTGNANFTKSAVYPDLNLANWFGKYLQPIEATHSLALVPVGKARGNGGGGGNHDYNGTIAEQSKTGTMTYYLGKTRNDLISLNFGVNATADTATAIISEGGTQLLSYNSVKTAADAITGAINPLKELPAQATTVRESLNQLITKDAAFKAKLAELGEALGTTVDPLKKARDAAAVTPTQLGQDEYMDDQKLAANNPLLLQLQTAAALFNAGLTHSATFCLGSNDVNGGGDHLQQGGNNTDRRGASAVAAKAMLAQFAAEFFRLYPKGVICFGGEGGRAPDGGDQNIMLGGIIAPKAGLRTTMLGYTGFYDSAANYGKPVQLKLSDGTTDSPSIANLMATAAKAAGYDFGDHAVIEDLLIKT